MQEDLRGSMRGSMQSAESLPVNSIEQDPEQSVGLEEPQFGGLEPQDQGWEGDSSLDEATLAVAALTGATKDSSSGGSKAADLVACAPQPVFEPERARDDEVAGSGECGGVGRTGGGCLKPSTRRQKHRLAQETYRNKQRARAQKTAEQLAALEQEVQDLTLKQDALMRRREALERALMCHSATTGAPFPLKWVLADPAAQAAVVAADTAAARSVSQAQNPLGWTGSAAQEAVAQELGLTGDLEFTVVPGAPVVMDFRQVAAMPEQEYGRLWHTYRNAMAACLLRMHEEGPDGCAARQLEGLVAEAQKLVLSLLLDTPNISRLHRRQPDAAAMQAVIDAAERPLSWWLQMLGSAQLSQQQMDCLFGLREAFTKRCAELHRDRRRCHKAAAMEPAVGSLSSSTSPQSAIEGFGRILQQEKAELLRAYASMLAVLTPVQYAHLSVAVAMHISPLCITNLMAIGAGRPCAARLLEDFLSEDSSDSTGDDGRPVVEGSGCSICQECQERVRLEWREGGDTEQP